MAESGSAERERENKNTTSALFLLADGVSRSLFQSIKLGVTQTCDLVLKKGFSDMASDCRYSKSPHAEFLFSLNQLLKSGHDARCHRNRGVQ